MSHSPSLIRRHRLPRLFGWLGLLVSIPALAAGIANPSADWLLPTPWLATLGVPGLCIGLWLLSEPNASVSHALAPPTPPAEADVAGPAVHGLLPLIQAIDRLAEGDFSDDSTATSPPEYAALAEAIATLRQRLDHAHTNLDASLNGHSAPDVGQPGRFGRSALQIALHRPADKQADALTEQVLQLTASGDFTAAANQPALADEPLGKALGGLIAQVGQALDDMARLSGALARGDLTERIGHTYPGQLGAVCRSLDQTALSLRETLGRIDAVVDTVTDAAREIAAGNESLSARTQDQAASLEETASSMEELNAVVQQNAETADSVTRFVSEATGMAEGSREVMLATRQTLDELASSARRIESIVSVIDGLAFQTNILALNAAVEAARAGEHGRGFAVVATEVRQLSLRSAEAAQDIRQLIAGTVNQSTSTVARVETLNTTLEALISTIGRINGHMGDIHSASQEQAQGLGQISQAIMRIDDNTQQTSTQVDEAAAATRQLYGQSRGLHNLLAEFQLGPDGERARAIHRDLPPRVVAAANAIGKLWEKALARQLLTEDDLFDTDYQAFGDTDPPKYTTRFDALADRLLPKLQEAFLDIGPYITYAIACDHNGYVPTHNQRYCEALTGDASYDKLHNRTKRIFSDPVGRRCGRHPLPFLLQTYRRDTGEIVHDLSAPVWVNGRHWGGFRVGYKTATELA